MIEKIWRWIENWEVGGGGEKLNDISEERLAERKKKNKFMVDKI